MAKISLNDPAPDFALKDYRGQTVELSAYKGEKHVLLVFNRGFTWPFCRAHMAQLRQYQKRFVEKDVVILVIGPEDAQKFKKYFKEHDLPFAGLPDPKHRVLKQYGQEFKLFKFGRMPAQVLVDKEGAARLVHYGNSMSDIPTAEDILALVDEIDGS